MGIFKKIYNSKFNDLYLFVTGLFLLISSNNAYVFGGYAIKLLTLIAGFSLIVLYYVRHTLHFGIGFRELINPIMFYIIVWAIAILKNQNIDSVSISFGIIVLSLYIIGYSLSKNSKLEIKLNRKYIALILLLTFFGSIYFILLQYSNFKAELNSDLRKFGDDSLNPNGVAFTQAILLIFVFWISRGIQSNEFYYFKEVSLLSVFLIILMTGARGAMLSLFLTFLLINLRSLFLIKFNAFQFFKAILFMLILSFVFFYMYLNIPIIEFKVRFFWDRLLSLFDFFDGSQKDLSINERTKVYGEFSENWRNYFFGKYNYIGYPHNLFLEIYMRWGVFGIPLIYFALRTLIFSVMGIYRARSNEKVDLIFLFSILYLFSFLQAQTSLSLEMNRTFWLSLGYFNGYYIRNV